MTEIEERTLKEAEHIVATKQTIRQSAKAFGVSKSTLHNDLKKRLPHLDKKLFLKVKKILDFNFEEKHIRGGQATKNKLLQKQLKE